MYLVMTLVTGLVFCLVFRRLKIVAGAMMGPLCGVALLNIFFNAADMPVETRLVAQIFAGAFIAESIGMDTLRKLPQMLGPVSMLLAGYLVLNLFVGGLIYLTNDNISLVTALMMCVPGGLSDIPIIAADMGGDMVAVMSMQLLRLLLGLGFLPWLMGVLTRRYHLTTPSRTAKQTEMSAPDSAPVTARTSASKPHAAAKVLLTLLVASVGGVLGKVSGIPAGALIFAMFSVILLNKFLGGVDLPPRIRLLAMLINGCYIGSTIHLSDIYNLWNLLLPAALIMIAYTVNCLGMSWLLKKFFGYSFQEGMLIATPAGASDIALIAADLGVFSPQIALLQVFRYGMVLIFFPQFIHAATLLL